VHHVGFTILIIVVGIAEEQKQLRTCERERLRKGSSEVHFKNVGSVGVDWINLAYDRDQ
jgi:hypothetical protein